MAGDSWEALQAEIIACRACPRLVAWREEVARRRRRAYEFPDGRIAMRPYWSRPLPAFGDRRARLLVVGLAPAAHGGNRTGRMFSGDSAGRTLVAALYRAGWANQPHSEGPGDGLELRGVLLTAVCRCVPPGNRPTAEELRLCRPFLRRELALLPDLRVVLALGRVAFEGFLRAWREEGGEVPGGDFRHGGVYPLGGGRILVATYHPSQRNTRTGRLTEEMLDAVLGQVREWLG